jgi:hypothetical protein
MKKRDFRKLALLGIASGFLISNQSLASETGTVQCEKSVGLSQLESLIAASQKCGGPHGCPGLTADRDRPDSDPNSGNMNYRLMTEDELLLELNEKGRALYLSLDPKGRKLARIVASQMCNNTNICRGYNACRTDQNDCAGQGSCEGKSKCSFSDKNLAVKVVADKLAKKRREALQGSSEQR